MEQEIIALVAVVEPVLLAVADHIVVHTTQMEELVYSLIF